METYEELKRAKQHLENQLKACSDIKGHHSYNIVEQEVEELKSKIKQLFRDKYRQSNV